MAVTISPPWIVAPFCVASSRWAAMHFSRRDSRRRAQNTRLLRRRLEKQTAETCLVLRRSSGLMGNRELRAASTVCWRTPRLGRASNHLRGPVRPSEREVACRLLLRVRATAMLARRTRGTNCRPSPIAWRVMRVRHGWSQTHVADESDRYRGRALRTALRGTSGAACGAQPDDDHVISDVVMVTGQPAF